MWINDSGNDYYLNEEEFKRAMSVPAPPLNMDELVAIQHQMKSAEDRIFEHMRQTSTPDPEAELRRYLDEKIGRERQEAVNVPTT